MTQKKRLLTNLAGAIVLAGGVSAYAYFGVFQAGEDEAARKAADEKLVELAAGEAKKLTVFAKGETTELERRDGAWRIVAPLDAAADDSAVDALLERLAGAKRGKAIAGDDPRAYGIDEPRVRVVVDGQELAVGKPNYFDGSHFARDARGRFVTIDAGLLRALDKSTFELRDKRLVRVPEKDVTAIELRGSHGPIRLARDGESWKLERPDREPASHAAATELLRAVQDLRATAFPAAELGEPKVEVTLQRAEGEPLAVRLAEADGKLLVRAGDGPVAEVAKAALARIDLDAERLREKRLFPVESSDVRRLVFSGEGGDFALERRDEAWWLTAPEEVEAEGWKANATAMALAGLEPESFVRGEDPARHGLAPARRKVELLGEAGRALGVLLLGDAAGDEVWVQREGEERLARVKASKLAGLPASAADARKAEPADAAKTAKAENAADD